MSTKILNDSISLFTSSRSDVKSTSKVAGMDFSKVMDKTIKSSPNDKLSSDNTNKKEDTITSASLKETSVSETVENKETDKHVSPNTEKAITDEQLVSETDKTQVEEVDGSIDNAFISSLAELSTKIEELLMNKLGLSKEELEEQLELLGITALDVLTVDNLKNLLLQVNGASDVSNFLTNENMANQLQELMTDMKGLEESFISEHKISTEEFDQMIIQNLETNNKEQVQVERNEEVSSVDTQDNTSKLTVVKEEAMSSNQSKDSKDESASPESSFEKFMNNLVGVNGNQSTSSVESIQSTNVAQIREIVNQIVDRIKVIIKPDMTTMEMQLNPENLGRINLSVAMKDGKLTAQFTATNETVKEALESQMNILKETLSSQGLKVEGIEVTVSNFEFTGSNGMKSNSEEQQGGSKKRKFVTDGGLDNDEGMIVDENQDDLNQLSGSTLDYSV